MRRRKTILELIPSSRKSYSHSFNGNQWIFQNIMREISVERYCVLFLVWFFTVPLFSVNYIAKQYINFHCVWKRYLFE